MRGILRDGRGARKMVARRAGNGATA